MNSSVQLDTFLGEGAFGKVYKGHDDIHPELAVKVMTKIAGGTDQAWQQLRSDLLNEAQRLRDAKHANVVEVKYVVQDPGNDAIWLVMEFCSSGSLMAKYEQGPMLLSDVKRVIADVGKGLHIVHGRGMIHRDIKPANILCENNRFKVGDFGLVSNEIVQGYASGAGYTTHLAPEVFNNHLTSISTDIWALGMTIYRLLHGEAFYNYCLGDFGEQEITAGGFADRLPWLSHIPQSWRKKIKRALEDDPKDRYKDPIELAQSFAQLEVPLDWKCTFAPFKTEWTAPKGDRTLLVIHQTHSQRKHSWEAESLGTSKIRKISKGDSGGMVGRTAALKGLSKLFSQLS